MKNVLISLVSEQTIPNLELIKEFGEMTNYHIIVHTPQTVKQKNWIIKAAQLTPEFYKTIEIDAFDINVIEQTLKDFNFPDENYYLNITGGTKVMILVFQEFFKNLGAKIYYVTGKNCEYLKVFPVIGERKLKLINRISLEEYLTVYGFDIKKSSPMNSFEQSKSILSFFLTQKMENYLTVLNLIRSRRGKSLIYNENDELQEFINQIKFIPAEPGKLNKYETKYLSGEWFEEYIYYQIKEELNLPDEAIGTGFNLKKENTPNEIDVLFVYHNKLFIIECKTSIVENRTLPDGKIKKFKLLPEIIYKSDALRNNFGLFANTSIITLEEIKTEEGKPIAGYETHFDRAELSRIKILSKKDLKSGKSFRELMKII